MEYSAPVPAGAGRWLRVGACQALVVCDGNGGLHRGPMDAARVRVLTAYKDFLTLWKDADPDIPILKEAKVEYAKLQ